MHDTQAETGSGGARTALDKLNDFSLVAGGPLYQLLRRTRLSGDALEGVRRRLLAMLLLIWVPPLLLSLVAGTCLGRQRGPAVSPGRRNPAEAAHHGAAADPGRGDGSPEAAADRAALRDERPDSRRGAAAVRRSGGLGVAAAQFGGRGTAAAGLRVCGGRAVHLERPGGTQFEQLVRHGRGRGPEAFVRGPAGSVS